LPTDHENPFVSVSLPTKEGMVHARHYVVPQSRSAVVLVGNSTQGFDSPAGNLYPRLAEALKRVGITTVQVALCNAESLDENVHDVRRVIHYLCGLGSKTLLIAGYGRGAAAVLHSVKEEPCVRGVIAIATSGPGDLKPPSCSLLVIHGTKSPGDRVRASVELYNEAADPKELHLVDTAGDTLDETPEEVYRIVLDWIQRQHVADNPQAA
jgi:predicted esterase